MTTHGPTEWSHVFESPTGAVAHVIAGFGWKGLGSLISYCQMPIEQEDRRMRTPWYIKFEGGKTEVARMPLSESVRPICKTCAKKIRTIQAELDAVGIYHEDPR